MKITLSTVFMTVGGILSVIGAYMAAIESSNEKDELIKRDQEIIALTKENSKLSFDSLNQITGGNSWAYLDKGVKQLHGIPSHPFGVNIKFVGDSPLTDVFIKLYEVEYDTNLPTRAYNLFEKLSKEISIIKDSLHKDSLGILTLPNKPRVDYLIHLKSRNGDISQHWIFMKGDNGYWSDAIKVVRYKPSKNGFIKENLLEKIESDFPEKNIEWIEY